MGSTLPEIEKERFRFLLNEVVSGKPLSRLASDAGTQVGPLLNPRVLSSQEFECTLDCLFGHFQEMRRWNTLVSLIGPGTADQILERHYQESLAAVSFLELSDKTLVDVGSGGGFPGFVLASARPDMDVYLIEPREKKRLFLKAAARRCKLSCQPIDGRVNGKLPAGLPEKIDVVTSRALALSREMFSSFLEHSSSIRFLLWVGCENPVLPADFCVCRELPLPGSLRRRILEICFSPRRGARR